jgi:hypothetical protein
MKRKRVFTLLAGAMVLMLGGQLNSPIQRTSLQEQIAEKQRRGYSVKFLDNTLVELTEPMTGAKHMRSLHEPSEAEIRAWAAGRGVRILEIDPTTIDTSRFSGMYRYFSTVPLSNDVAFPLVVGDIDRNRKADVYGAYLDSIGFRTRVYEVDSIGVVTFGHEFIPRMGHAIQLTDLNRDCLWEVNYQLGDTAFNLTQLRSDALPTQRQFYFLKYEYNGTALKTREFIGDLDGDSLTDFLYRGSVLDSVRGFVMRTNVAEFDRGRNNFRRVWSSHLFNSSDSYLSNYQVDDFDADGRKDILSSELGGRVVVAENDGDNSYSVVWRDSAAFFHSYYLGSGDIDRDGLPEFFVAARHDGTWINVYEADGNNSYSLRLLIHLLSGGLFDESQYLTLDTNGDGKLELVVCSGRDVYMFNSRGDNDYFVSYLMRANSREAIQFYDFNRDGRLDFILSKAAYVNPPGYIRYYADIYTATGITVAVSTNEIKPPGQVRLFQNFPNPYNPSTTIEFFLPSAADVRLAIYDALGKEIEVLVAQRMEPGFHSALWRAKGISSGVYFYRLEAGKFVVTKKMVVVQ